MEQQITLRMWVLCDLLIFLHWFFNCAKPENIKMASGGNFSEYVNIDEHVLQSLVQYELSEFYFRQSSELHHLELLF